MKLEYDSVRIENNSQVLNVISMRISGAGERTKISSIRISGAERKTNVLFTVIVINMHE